MKKLEGSEGGKRRYKSGAQKERDRKQRVEQERQNELTRRERAGEIDRPDVGRPPLTAVGNVAWANNVAAAMLYDVLHDPAITTEQRWKVGSDLIAKIGMTYSKAATEDRIAKLEKAMGILKEQQDDDGLEPDPEAEFPPSSDA